jgi:hypothetical protein
MAISKSNAEAAVNALKKLGGSALATLMSQNTDHLFKKHLCKAKALAEAQSTGHPQGYFKKVETKVFNNSTEFKEMAVPLKKKDNWLAARNIASINKKTAGRVKGELKYNTATTDLGTILLLSLSDGGYALYQSNQNPEARFLYVVEVPSLFVGRAIASNATVDKGVNWVVVVVSATGSGNPGLVTVYPADDDYVNGLTALV